MAYYSRIKELRLDNDKTQAEIAAYLGMKQPQYYRYETGLRDVPSEVLISLSRLYNVSVDYILGVTDKK